MRNKGFTLIELMIVTLMIGILSAIAVPSWAAFVNRQRVYSANDAILRALRRTQSEAKRTKLSYSISFKTESSVPKFAVYPAGSTPSIWESPISEIKPGQLIIGTNLTAENTAGSSLVYGSATAQTITLDYRGVLVPDPNLGPNQVGLIVVVAAPKPGTTQAIDASRRCTRVLTLLGASVAGKENECNAQ